MSESRVDGPPPIDFHMHVYPTRPAGERRKAAYEIWEYGRQPSVTESADSGDPDEALAALDRGGISRGVIANLFELEHVAADVAETGWAGGQPEALDDVLRAFNAWACDLARREPRFIPFLAIDPQAMNPTETVAHLREMATSKGARGIKLHPVLQGIDPLDRDWWPVFEACAELGLVVLSHSGPARPGAVSGEPRAFGPLMKHVPSLTLVLAHLGGGAWRDTAEVARDLPNVLFDVCEIIERTGSERGPTAREMAHLIGEIGPDRVLFGSDWPWYEPAHSLAVLRSLPGLSASDVAAIAGGNAARVLGL
jgi:predicted TIM-barrel fold metal-dependent hydrolase